MGWYLILILLLGIPILSFAVAYVLFLTIGGVYSIVKDAREMRAFRRKAMEDARQLEGVSEEETGKAPMEKIYLVCQRCSKTVDTGRDGPYPRALFVPGYCDRCASFLLERAKKGEIEKRLESVVLVCGDVASKVSAAYP
jgi:hypothetical protein